MFKNKLISRTLIFIAIVMVFFLFDQLSKFFLYDDFNKNVDIHDWYWLGIRSNHHPSTTFFDAMGIFLPLWAISLIGVLVSCFLIVLFYFFKNTLCATGIAISLSGVLGNTIDNLFSNGVRNIIFIPAMDRGTFNLADVFIILGGSLFLVGVLINYFLERNSVKKEKNAG